MENAIREVTCAIFEMMLGQTLENGPGGVSEETSDLVGEIRITGAFEGMVRLGCSQRFARQAAEIVFGESDAPELATSVVAELTNMAGGNLKALLAGPSRLSLPCVTSGAGEAQHPQRAGCLGAVEMRCGDEPIIVSLYASPAGH